jgi:hypothetical protein
MGSPQFKGLMESDLMALRTKRRERRELARTAMVAYFFTVSLLYMFVLRITNRSALVLLF